MISQWLNRRRKAKLVELRAKIRALDQVLETHAYSTIPQLRDYVATRAEIARLEYLLEAEQ